MSLFNNELSPSKKPQESNSIFGGITPECISGNKLFESQKNNDVFLKNNSLFSGVSNVNNTFENNIGNKKHIFECSLYVQFEGRIIQDIYGEELKFMSIVILPEFDYASQEEIRLADYIKKNNSKDGNFKDNQNKNIREIT